AILLASGAAATAVVLVGAGPIAGLVGSPKTAPLIALAALWIIPLAVIRVPTSVFEGFQEMKYSFLAALVREPIKVAFFLAFAAVGFTVRLAVAGWVLWSVVALGLTLAIFMRFLRKQGLRLTEGEPLEPPGLLASSRYLYLPFLSVCLLPVLLRILVNRFSPTGGVGTFHNAMTLAMMTMMVFLPISQALLPTLAHAHARRQSLKALAHTSMRFVGLVAFLGLMFYSFLSAQLLTVVYGPAYREGGLFLAMAVVGIFFEAFKVVTNPLLKGAMQARAVTWIEVVRLVVTLATGIPLTMRFGPLGMMEGFVLGCLVTTVLQFFYVHRLLGIHCWTDAVLPTLWAALLCGGWMLGYFVPGLGSTIPVAGAIGAVALLMIVRPPVTLSELKVIWNLIRWQRTQGTLATPNNRRSE
ncbi:MAG: polysaccharide biosynthesis C-terminal domain-containing protein, partial [Phycisphaerae bacterium]